MNRYLCSLDIFKSKYMAVYDLEKYASPFHKRHTFQTRFEPDNPVNYLFFLLDTLNSAKTCKWKNLYKIIFLPLLQKNPGHGRAWQWRQLAVAAALAHPLAARLDDVVEQDERLVDVPPVLAVVVDALPHHLHDLAARDDVVGEVGDLRHQRARRAPRVVRRRLAHLHLRQREVVDDVLQRASDRHDDGGASGGGGDGGVRRWCRSWSAGGATSRWPSCCIQTSGNSYIYIDTLRRFINVTHVVVQSTDCSVYCG